MKFLEAIETTCKLLMELNFEIHWGDPDSCKLLTVLNFEISWGNCDHIADGTKFINSLGWLRLDVNCSWKQILKFIEVIRTTFKLLMVLNLEIFGGDWDYM